MDVHTSLYMYVLICLGLVSIQQVECQGEITFTEGLNQLSYWSHINKTELHQQYTEILKVDVLNLIFSQNVFGYGNVNRELNDSSSDMYNVSKQCLSDFETFLTSLGQKEPYALQSKLCSKVIYI